MDGTPDGKIKCTIGNWIGVVYKIPIKELDSCREREELKYSGVYFLIGASDKDSEPVIYVGQARSRKNGEGTNQRLNEHHSKSKDFFWSEAIVLTTSNNSLGATEISYLENRFFSLANEAHRYKVLGRRVFEPIVKKSAKQNNLPVTPVTTNVIFLIKQEIKGDKVNARAIRTPEGIVVLSGSKLREKPVRSCPKDAKANRRKYRDLIDENHILQADILFDTPSSAAKFVLLRSANGNTEWKTKEGITLSQYEKGY